MTAVATNERFTWEIAVETSCIGYQPSATAAMTDDTPFPFDLSAVRRKKLTVDFDRGNQFSNGGLPLLQHAERKLGICRRIADAMADRRDPSRIWHAVRNGHGARLADRMPSTSTGCGMIPS
jgi:hypothetical protein